MRQLNSACAASVLMVVAFTAEAEAQPELVCASGSPGLAAAPAGREAAFRVGGDGDAQWLGDAGSVPTDATDNRVTFQLGSPPPAGSSPPDSVVRVEAYPQSNPTAVRLLACGRVAVGTTVIVDLPPEVRGVRHLMRVAIHRELVASEQPRFARLSEESREALETDAFRAEMIRAQLAASSAEPLTSVREHIAARRYRAARAQLDQLATTLTTHGSDLSSQPYGRALELAHAQAAAWASSVRDALDPLLALCPAPVDAECAESNATVSAAARNAATTRVSRSLDQLDAAASGGLDPLLRQRACSRAARLRWLDDGTRLVAVHELPLTTRPVLQARYDRGRHPVHHMTAPYTGGIMMIGVPTAQTDLAFRQTTGEELASNFTVAIRRFLQLAAGVGDAAHANSVCAGLPSVEAIDDVPPLSPVGARSWVLNDPVGDRITEVSVCAGASCSTGASSNVRDELRLRPRHDVEWAALLEAGFAALPAQLTPSAELAYTRAAYHAAGGNQGPEQLFVLQNDVRAASLFTLSALFGVSFPIAGPRTRALVAAGVVLFDFEGRRAFQEYVVRFGIPLWWENVYLTVGAGIGWMPIRVDPGQAEAIVVTRPMGSGSVPATPTVALADEAVFTLSLGLALDVAVFGDAVDDVIEALGGGS